MGRIVIMWTYWKFLALFFYFTALTVVYGGSSRRTRETSDLTAGNWDSCKPGADAPPTRVPTLDRVNQLRTYFSPLGIQAYLVPNADAHQSEYPSQYDKRRGFISGFQGSAGFAVITIDKQALWTDGRYFLEAEDTLDCDWILMREREPGVPTMIEWLKKELRWGNFVGASPYLVGSSDWKYYKDELSKHGIYMDLIQDELVDRFWSSGLGRPDQPNSHINVLPLEFSGRTWQDKVSDMRTSMEEEEVDMMVVTGLDETAWLFNLRAGDIDYNPFFISYAIVEKDKITLYILDHAAKITANPTDEASTMTVADQLNTNTDGTCTGKTGDCVEVKAYDPGTVINDVKSRSNSENVRKVWLGYNCNFAIYSAVNESKIHQDNTPVATTKVKKNQVEVQGMKNSHIRDAVALISFMAQLEEDVKAGKKRTELSASQDLERSRRAQKSNRGLSFPSISSSGSNGAIIHYRPSNLTDKRITNNEMYLLDSGGQYLEQKYNRGLSFDSISGFGANGAIIHYSVTNVTSIDITTKDMYLLDSGGQYLDGTTDVTRTFHFGSPTTYQKECYTRVLMGQINLFQAKWPKGLYGREIDAFARAPLWDVGLVYRHGTGHGIGMYLSVHEGPGRIALSHRSFDYDNILDENQFFSDGPAYMTKSHTGSLKYRQILDEYLFISNEPGFYEDGAFGIRLENIVMVKNATTTYQFPGTQFLTFEHITLVPYEPHLINFDLLSERQIEYLNDYNEKVRDHVGPELNRQGKTEGYDWMMKRTEPISRTKTSGAQQNGQSLPLIALFAVFAYIRLVL